MFFNTSERLLQQGIKLEQAAALAQAEQKYRLALEKKPSHVGALLRLARLCFRTNRSDEALRLIRLGVSLDSGSSELHLMLGRILLSRNEIAEAKDALIRAAALDPTSDDARFHLGLSLQTSGDYQAAADAYRAAIALTSDHVAAHNNLGVVLGLGGDPEQAERAFARASELDPSNASAHVNRAAALTAMGRVDDAIAAYEQGARAAPRDAAVRIALGDLLSSVGRPGAAIHWYREAMGTDPRAVQAYTGLAAALSTVGKKDQALAVLRTASVLRTDTEQNRFDLAALGDGTPPPKAPRGYVAALFNQFAERFDQHMSEQLNYHGSELLAHAVRSLVPPDQKLDILDLGCGTGLAAVAFAPMIKSITGVDLAREMIEHARRRNLYTKLAEADVAEFLSTTPDQSFDLVVAADLFIYIGDFAEVTAGVRRVLRPGGLFAFTLEAQDESGFSLGVARRYKHSLSYTRELAAKYTFEEVLLHPVPLRLEMGKPVAGYVVVWRRSGST